MNTYYSNLKQALKDIQVIQKGEFQLKSGEKSSVYIDLRRVISYPQLLRQIATTMWETFSKKHTYSPPALVCGVPYGALPLSTCIALDQTIPLIMCRKTPKTHGLSQLIEGVYQKGQHCLVVEDVITTGNSVLNTIDVLEAHGLKVKDILVFLDREKGAKQAFEARGYCLHRVFTIDQIVDS